MGARTTRAPCEEELTTKSSITPTQACLDTAVASRSAHTERSRGKPLSTERQNRAGSDVSELRQEIATFTTWRPSTAPLQQPGDALDCHFLDPFNHAFLQGHGSDTRGALLSTIRHVKRSLGRNREQTLPRSHGPPFKVEGAHTQFCSTTLAIRGTNGHREDRFLRQFEIVCARDYDRLLGLPATQRLAHTAAGFPVDDRGRSLDRSSAPAAAEPVYLAFRPACLQQNIPLHRGASERHSSRSGTLFTAPRRSVARRRNGPQKPGLDQSTRTLKKKTRALQRVTMLDPATVACGQTNRKVTSNIVCAISICSDAAKRRSGQAACKQSLRSSKQHRTILDLSVSGRGPTWWARRLTAAQHIPLTNLSHTIVALLAG